jgi:hypothetical protein
MQNADLSDECHKLRNLLDRYTDLLNSIEASGSADILSGCPVCSEYWHKEELTLTCDECEHDVCANCALSDEDGVPLCPDCDERLDDDDFTPTLRALASVP